MFKKLIIASPHDITLSPPQGATNAAYLKQIFEKHGEQFLRDTEIITAYTMKRVREIIEKLKPHDGLIIDTHFEDDRVPGGDFRLYHDVLDEVAPSEVYTAKILSNGNGASDTLPEKARTAEVKGVDALIRQRALNESSMRLLFGHMGAVEQNGRKSSLPLFLLGDKK